MQLRQSLFGIQMWTPLTLTNIRVRLLHVFWCVVGLKKSVKCLLIMANLLFEKWYSTPATLTNIHCRCVVLFFKFQWLNSDATNSHNRTRYLGIIETMLFLIKKRIGNKLKKTFLKQLMIIWPDNTPQYQSLFFKKKPNATLCRARLLVYK